MVDRKVPSGEHTVIPPEISGVAKDLSEPNALDANLRLEKIQRFICEAGIENPEEIIMVFGGLVHHVFRVITKEKEYYLKIRADYFIRMPAVKSNPKEIRYEAKALRIASHLFPETFPHVVATDEDRGLLLISSIMQPKDNLLHRLEQREIRCDDIAIIGKNFGEIHNAFAFVKDAVREDSDEQEYRNNLLYRLGSQNNIVLEGVILKLSSQSRTLIIGDLSPKNLGLVDRELRICDLESVHRGNPIFDVGFFIGHLYVHSLESGYPAAKFTRTFLKAYRSLDKITYELENLLLQQIVLGIILYRLNNKRVPYSVNMTNAERLNIVNETNRLLARDIVGWESIEERLRYAKSH